MGAAVLSLVTAAATAAPPAAGPAGVGATAVSPVHPRATVLYYLTEFIEWPTQPRAPAFVIGIVRDAPLEAALADVLRNRTRDGLPFVVSHLSKPSEVAGCRMVYIGDGGRQAIEPYLQAARAANVLTVGGSRTFESLGGMITLLPTHHWPRIEINRRAAEQAQLWISSRLLGLATVIQEPRR